MDNTHLSFVRSFIHPFHLCFKQDTSVSQIIPCRICSLEEGDKKLNNKDNKYIIYYIRSDKDCGNKKKQDKEDLGCMGMGVADYNTKQGRQGHFH